MARGSHSYSILQGRERKCYLTGAVNVPLHKHHIYYGTALRKVSDKHGFFVWLIPELHNLSNKGVHFNRDLDLKLKRECQTKYEETHTRAEFMALIGKNYLD